MSMPIACPCLRAELQFETLSFYYTVFANKQLDHARKVANRSLDIKAHKMNRTLERF